MKDDYVHPRGQAPGMDMRDWFAGMAMQGFVARYGTDLSANETACVACTLADAMMHVREMNIDEIIDFLNDIEEEQTDD